MENHTQGHLNMYRASFIVFFWSRFVYLLLSLLWRFSDLSLRWEIHLQFVSNSGLGVAVRLVIAHR